MTLQTRIYTLRTSLCLAILALLAVNDTLCRGQPGSHLWLLAAGVLYPHVGHWLLGHLDISRRRGHLLFLADGLFAGAVVGALELSLLPTLVLVVINLFNWMIVGGPLLIALGIASMFAGALSAGTSLDPIVFSPVAACNATHWLASIIAVGYFLIVARIIHRLIGELRLQQVAFQTRSDSASSAQAMAEQALLAVLPASAAQTMADKGALPPETLQDATLLLLDFAPADGSPPTLDELADAFHICTQILARHGIELVKTFGSRCIALSRRGSGLDDALAAFLEIDGFIRDHGARATPGHAARPPRASLHQGRVTVGLVQPERMNIDLCGEAVNELCALASASASGNTNRQIPALTISASAYRKLRKSADFVPTPSGPIPPDSYTYAPHPIS